MTTTFIGACADHRRAENNDLRYLAASVARAVFARIARRSAWRSSSVVKGAVWVPLQYLAVEGLNAYGEKAIAAEIARRWIRLNIRAYEASGVLQEKYDVETINVGRPAGGGEYSLQVGFGWTNGVLAKLMAEYPTGDRPPASDHKIRQN
jgi:hypothetical protein